MNQNVIYHNIRLNAVDDFYGALKHAKQLDFFIPQENRRWKIARFKNTYQSGAIFIKVDNESFYIVEGTEEDYKKPIYEYYYLSIKKVDGKGDLFHIASLVANDNGISIEVYSENESTYENGRQIADAKVDVGIRFSGKNEMVFISLFHIAYNLIFTTDIKLAEKIQSEGIWRVQL